MNIIEQMLADARHQVATAKEAKGLGYEFAASIAMENAEKTLRMARYTLDKAAQRRHLESEQYRAPRKEPSIEQRNPLDRFRLTSIIDFVREIGYVILWKTIFGFAWLGCWIEDEIWSPIWWYFNKKRFERKKT